MVLKKLENYLTELKNEYGIPFSRLRITKNKETIFDFYTGTKYKDKNLYYIYSMTKLVTSVAAMRLVEQKKLFLDDEIEKYLPEYGDMNVKISGGIKKAQNKIKVKHLLSMQGGFNYDINTKEFAEAKEKNPNASTREMVSALAKRPLEFEPGEDFSYSLCYDVLGAVIEVASGMKLGEFYSKEIFEPLGMKSVTFDLKSVEKEKLLPLYKFNPESGKADDISSCGNAYIFTPEYESGGAGLISSFEDYAEFIRTLANGGNAENGYKLLEAESIEEIRKNPMSEKMITETYERYKQWGCTYGFSVRTLQNHSVAPEYVQLGSFELTGAAGSYAVIDIENNVSIVYFQHILDVREVPEIVHHKIRDLVYEELKNIKEA